MSLIKRILSVFILLGVSLTSAFAQDNIETIGRDGLGQTIQINMNLTGVTGKPTWLITIRDVDNNQNVPYMFDITKDNHYWLLFTYGRNYLISASDMQITKFSERYNDYRSYQIHDFCNIESHGRISRGESMSIWITGELTPNMDKIHCQVNRFNDPNFHVAPANNAKNE